MILIRSLSEALANPLSFTRPIVTPGLFDGLHRGHQALLDDLRTWATDLDGIPVVITFHPHPRIVVSGEAPPAVLSLEHRLTLLERSGVAATMVVAFDENISQWSPEQFIETILIRAMGSRHLLLGFDSTIGHRRIGTFEYLSERADRLGITVKQSTPFLMENERISSTLVRRAVISGDLPRLESLCGRPHSIIGEVIRGECRGRTLGYPTANLRIDSEAVLPGGVYFARVRTLIPPGCPTPSRPIAPVKDGTPAMVNIGRQPTFNISMRDPLDFPRFDPAHDRIEVHLIDFDGDLYGSYLEVEFYRRHRSEVQFPGARELKEQLYEDEKALREWAGVL